MKNLFFYIPFFYTVATRLKTKKSQMAWFFTYLLPVYIVFFHIYGLLFLAFFLCIGAVYTVYEIGYIYNDSELTKREKNPTLRLNSNQLSYYFKSRVLIFSIRLLLFFAILLLLFLIDKTLSYSVLVCCSLILLMYILYNSIRSRWSIPLYSGLVFLRYFGVFVLATTYQDLLWLWVVYPLCASIEFSSKAKYRLNLSLVSNNYDFFRLMYYLVVCMLFVVASAIGFEMPYYICQIVFYFLIYRLIAYFLLSNLYRGKR